MLPQQAHKQEPTTGKPSLSDPPPSGANTMGEKNAYDSDALAQYLLQFKVEKSQLYNFTTFGSKCGSYMVHDVEGFLAELVTYQQHGVVTTVTQKPGAASPYLVDFDFNWPQQQQRAWDDSFVSRVIEAYARAASKYVVVPPDSVAYLRHRVRGYMATNKQGVSKWKDGFHIVFPDWHWPKALKLAIRRDVMSDTAVVTELTALGCSNPIKDIVDEAVISRNNWFPYGCDKPNVPARAAAKMWKVVDGKAQQQPCTQDVKELALRLRVDVDTSNAQWQPEWSLERVEGLQPGTPPKTPTLSRVASTSSAAHVWEGTWESLQAVVLSLSAERADSYSTWTSVGFSLLNLEAAAPTPLDMLELWLEFSQKSPKYDKNEAMRWWYANHGHSCTYGAGYLWARCKEDSPTTFWQHKITIDTGHQVGVARTFTAMYPGEFCTHAKGIYHFEGHRWMLHSSDAILFTMLTESVAPLYKAQAAKWQQQAAEAAAANDKGLAEQLEKQAKPYAQQALNLNIHSFLSGAVKLIRVNYTDDSFQQRLDSNKDLLGFEDGVYDLRKKEFRSGQPQDMVSMSTGMAYPAGVDSAAALEFLSQLFPNPELREYAISHYAYCLSGHRYTEEFHVHTGSGENGKSAEQNLVATAFGDYCYKAPVSMMTQARGASGGAQPELLKLKGKRVVQACEPEDVDRNGRKTSLNMSLIKELTGGDSMTVRGLYSDCETIRPTAAWHIACNQLPAIPSNDNGTWRRIRRWEYESRFKHGVQANPELHLYPVDTQLTAKTPQLARELMALLLSKYEHGMSVPVPACVEAANQAFFAEHSPLLLFKEQCLQHQDGEALALKVAKQKYTEVWLPYQAALGEEAVDLKLKDVKSGLDAMLGVARRDQIQTHKHRARNAWPGWCLNEAALNEIEQATKDMEAVVPEADDA